MATEPRGNVSAMAAEACAGRVGPARASRQNSPRAREVSNAGAKRGTLRGTIKCTPPRLGGPPSCFGTKSHANGLHLTPGWKDRANYRPVPISGTCSASRFRRNRSDEPFGNINFDAEVDDKGERRVRLPHGW